MNRVPSLLSGARALAGVGVLALALAACQRQEQQPTFERPPAPVTVAAAVVRDTPLYIDAVGRTVRLIDDHSTLQVGLVGFPARCSRT